jgi:hypothetical protein
MARRLLLLSLAYAGIALLPHIAKGNFHLRNHSSEVIKAHVMFTFIHKDGFVYQRKMVTLGPGEEHEFDTGDVNTTRVLYLFMQNAKTGNFNFTNKSYRWNTKQFSAQCLDAPCWPSPFDDEGNKYVAIETAKANFSPIRNLMPGSNMMPAMRIQPNTGSTGGCEFTYTGTSGPINIKMW